MQLRVDLRSIQRDAAPMPPLHLDQIQREFDQIGAVHRICPRRLPPPVVVQKALATQAVGRWIETPGEVLRIQAALRGQVRAPCALKPAG